MENTFDSMQLYDGAFKTTNPTKIEFLLNRMLHKPSTALIIEPVKNHFWIFYYGGATYPESEPEMEHFISNYQAINILNSITESLGQWTIQTIAVPDTPDRFFDLAMSVLNSIRNKESIKIATEETEANRKIHIFYKN